MKNENGKGCVMKLSGQRKRPYALRITIEYDAKTKKQKYKYISYHETREEAEMALVDYIKYNHIEVKPYHHLHDSRLYRIWWGMIGRCENIHHISYKYYGARGIKVCEEWRNDFKSFYDWAIANGYKDDLTIDRIDCNSDYKPSNCRWATYKEQIANRRKSTPI